MHLLLNPNRASPWPPPSSPPPAAPNLAAGPRPLARPSRTCGRGLPSSCPCRPRAAPRLRLPTARHAPLLHAHPDRAYRPPDAPLRCSCASAQPTDRRTCSPVARRRRRSQGFFFQNVDVGIDIC
uniref:Uncharacterized protein n=1 Tax=Setaria viridis TaxID=4556 RepID=A0A4U6W8T8_SETVI|nr:hypothetical protein SEVIR_1G036376v2 [Setaria viridis]